MQNNYCSVSGLSAYPPSSTYTFPASGATWTANNGQIWTTTKSYDVNWPEPSDWECELFGTGQSLVLRPSKDKVPNWFWRQMQYICFGNKWKKLNDSNKGS